MKNNENNFQNQEKKQSKGVSVKLVIIIVIAVLVIGLIGGYLLSKNETKSSEESSNAIQANNDSSNTIQPSNNTSVNQTAVNSIIQDEKYLCMFSNVYADGSSECLYVYNVDNNMIEFKYHNSLKENDINGIATKQNKHLYIYEKDNSKVEIYISTGESSIYVSVYNNGVLESQGLLWNNQVK